MAEDDTGAAAAPYTNAARARLVAAYEACEPAELVRAAVPIGDREPNPDGTATDPGSVLADAARVLVAARRYVEAAAVFERPGGPSWELIGEVLGVSAHTARYGSRRQRPASGRDCSPPPGRTTVEPRGSCGEVSWWRASMAREPLEAALDLDDWVLRHRDGDTELGTAPVSGGLPRRH